MGSRHGAGVLWLHGWFASRVGFGMLRVLREKYPIERFCRVLFNLSV
jgi:hypothetical protein